MERVIYSLDAVERLLKKVRPSKVCIVTSRPLARKLAWAIKKIPHACIVYIPDGERAKEWSEVERLLKQFIRLDLDHASVVVALGGGTVGDMAGFAASIYMRGIRYVQVPTTLLAQVDSAHGGKTGIDFMKYKNLVGVIKSPLATVVDVRFLRALPKAQIADGLGEVLKAGFIKDPSILALLMKESVTSFAKSPRLVRIIRRAIEVKHFYIEKDPEEQDIRKALNAGHTVGHALELAYGMSHGQAVIAGMRAEMAAAERLGLASATPRKRLEQILSHLGIKIRDDLKPDWSRIVHDKKVAGKMITLPIVERPGTVRLVPLKLTALKRALR